MDVFLGVFQFGPLEIALVAMAALLLFGKRLPDLARSLGKGVTEFKKGLSGVENELKETAKGQDEELDSPEGKTKVTWGFVGSSPWPWNILFLSA